MFFLGNPWNPYIGIRGIRTGIREIFGIRADSGHFFCRICPFFLLFSRNPWNPWKSVESVGIREFYGIRKSVNPQIRITRETRKNAKRNRETEFLRSYLSSYSRRHITLQHVRYELSVSVHHVHSKQKYAVCCACFLVAEYSVE
jgi:hypothetical protein